MLIVAILGPTAMGVISSLEHTCIPDTTEISNRKQKHYVWAKPIFESLDTKVLKDLAKSFVKVMNKDPTLTDQDES